jgi:L-ascorbate metabolism protein UlaG (beta-lactamase superfamily)
VCHFGDFGQSSLRHEQADAIGAVDLLFIPVGGTPTIGAEQAAAVAQRIGPRWIVPMHYRTPRIGFLETADGFLERMSRVRRLTGTGFDTADLEAEEGQAVIVPAAP